MFRDSFKSRRCLMPASGYYEWHDTPEGKQPYYFTRRDGQVMTIAAIHDAWSDPHEAEKLWSCAMLITEPNKFVADWWRWMDITIFEQITSALTVKSICSPLGPDLPGWSTDEDLRGRINGNFKRR